MDTFLPSELLEEIFSHLDFVDLKSLRLVNKSVAERVTPRLFSAVGIWLQKESIEILLHISQQTHLREHVRHLRIAFELFLVDPEEFNITYCHDGGVCDEWGLFHDCGGCDCEYMSKKESDQIVEDHRWIDKPDEGSKLLARALQALPNLTSIEISGRLPAYMSKHRLIHRTPSMYGMHSYAEWYGASGRKQFYFFMRALIEAGGEFNLKTLAIKDNADSLHDPPAEHLSSVHAGIVSKSLPEYMNIANLAFRNLEKLTWAYPLYTLPHSTEQNAVLGGLLRAMPNLKDLSLSDSSRHFKRFEISRRFGEIMFENLHTIRLHKLEFAGRELYEFAARHSATLRFFEMGCSRIIYPTFKFFLMKLREQTALESFTLYHDICLYTDKGEFKFPLWYGEPKDKAAHAALTGALSDYVTRKTDVYPHEMLLSHMQRNKHQITYDPNADNRFIEYESEDEGE